MARFHIEMPDQLMAEVDTYCVEKDLIRARVLRKWVSEGLGRARAPAAAPHPLAMAEIANPVAAPLPTPPAPAEPATDLVATIERDGATWFLRDGVCAALRITVESLYEEIDEVDDVLMHDGEIWIDEMGIAEARGICPNPEVSDEFWRWAQTKIIT